MKKRLSRIIVIALAMLICASSALAVQYLPQQGQGQQAAKAGGVPAEAASSGSAEAGTVSAGKEIQEPEKTAQMTAETVEENDAEENDTAVIDAGEENTVEENDAVATKAGEGNENEEPAQELVSAAAKADKPSELMAAETETTEKSTPSVPYRLSEGVRYSFLSTIAVKSTGETAARNIRLQVPLVTDDSPYFEILQESFPLEPEEINIVDGTRIGLFRLGNLEPGEEFRLQIRTVVKTFKIDFFADYVPGEKGVIAAYLNPAAGIESTDMQIVSIAEQLTANHASDWDKAYSIVKWVAASLNYSDSAANRNQGALAALQSGSGVCEDYAKLSVALARAAGIPSRVVYGYTDSGSSWPSNAAFPLRGYRHAWAEFYLAGRGWVPADPTRSNSSRLYFGTFPHNRYIVQNYSNASMKGTFSGGNISVSWEDSVE